MLEGKTSMRLTEIAQHRQPSILFGSPLPQSGQNTTNPEAQDLLSASCPASFSPSLIPETTR